MDLGPLLESCWPYPGQTPGTIIVGVSGGRDSMVLMTLIARWLKAQHPSARLVVAHVNYGLRGEESEGDAEFVEKAVKALDWAGVSFRLHRAAPPTAPMKSGPQAWARQVRRTFFKQLIREARQVEDIGPESLVAPPVVALAHHAQDQLETLLIRWLRGSGLVGLRGMQAWAHPYWRPLLHQDDIAGLAKTLRVAWREDSSNQTDAYYRNRIRHRLIEPGADSPLADISPNWRQTLLDTSARIDEHLRCLERHADTVPWYEGLASHAHRIHLEPWLTLPDPALSLQLRIPHVVAGYRQASWCLELAGREAGTSVRLPNPEGGLTYRAFRGREGLLITLDPKDDVGQVITLPAECSSDVQAETRILAPWRVTVEAIEGPTSDVASVIVVSSTARALTVRQWRPGERIVRSAHGPTGKSPMIKVADWLDDVRFEPGLRSYALVLIDGDSTLVWAQGGLSQRLYINRGKGRWLQIDIGLA